MKPGQAVIAICVLSFALTVPVPAAALEELVSKSELTTYELATDSTFESEPDVIYGENRTCFSHWYQRDSQGTDQNVLCLNWTHQAGIRYNYNYIPPSYSGPEYADHVGLRIPLAYPYNITPLGLKGTFAARILSTGDFVGSEWLASIDVYLVTETGLWLHLDTARRVSSIDFGAARQFFEYGTVDFGGEATIELGGAFDIVLLLAPTWYFGSYEEGGWQTMSGTVAVEVWGVSAQMLFYNPTSIQTLQPYRGDHINLTSAWPTGPITTDSSEASYSLFESSDTDLVVKWDRDLRIVCNRTLNTPNTHFVGILYSGGRLYFYGRVFGEPDEERISLVCADLEVNVLWSREYHLGIWAAPVTAGTGEDGSVLIAGFGYDHETVRFSWLMAFLPDGTLLLNTTFSLETLGIYDICALHGQRMYGISAHDGLPACYSLDGELLWIGEAACYDMAVGPEGHVYAWLPEYSGRSLWWTGYTLSRYDSYGSLLWNRTLEVMYPGGWNDSLSLLAVDVRSDGRFFATFFIYRYLSRFLLYSVNADGQSEVVRTLYDWTPYESVESETPVLIRGLDSCLLVLAHSYSDSGNRVYTMLSYQDSALTGASYSLSNMLGTASAAALLVGWVLYDRVGKQKLSYRLRPRVEAES